MDKRLLERIRDLVRGGIVGLGEVRRNIQHFVTHDLFTEDTVPDRSNSSFWPSSKAIMNAIYRASRFAIFDYSKLF